MPTLQKKNPKYTFSDEFEKKWFAVTVENMPSQFLTEGKILQMGYIGAYSMDELKLSCFKNGFNAVIGLHVVYTELYANHFLFYGTAIKY